MTSDLSPDVRSHEEAGTEVQLDLETGLNVVGRGPKADLLKADPLDGAPHLQLSVLVCPSDQETPERQAEDGERTSD